MVEVRRRKYRSGKEVFFIDSFVDGKRKRKVVGTSKKLAEQIAKDAEVKKIKGESDLYLKEISVGEFFELVKKYNQTNLRARTATRYANAIDNLADFLCDRLSARLSSLSPSTIEDYKTHAKGKLSDGTINTEIKIFRTAFAFAIRLKYLRTNPAREIKSIAAKPKIPDAYSADEIARIVKHSPPPFDDIFRLFLQTGMRRDELRFLQVGDIDFAGGLIHIRAKDGFEPKTGEDSVPMTSEAREILARHCTKTGRGFIFTNRPGHPYHARMFMDVIQRAGRAAGVDHPTIHRLRHSFCSHLLARGIDIEIIRKLARHSQISTTQRYLHVKAEQLQKSVEVLSGLGTPMARAAKEKAKAPVNHLSTEA